MIHPQRYSTRVDYRPPAPWYRRLNRIGVVLTSLGLAPRGAVTLEVRGRRTGRIRRIPVMSVRVADADHLVSLAGESDWVRNVRAAGGAAVLRRLRARPVHLDELPVEDRAPVIAAYLEAGRTRGGSRTHEDQAHYYFGVGPDPSPDDIARWRTSTPCSGSVTPVRESSVGGASADTRPRPHSRRSRLGPTC